MRHIACAYLLPLALLLGAAACAPAAEAPKAPAAGAAPPAAGQDVVIKTLPGIVVDTKAKEVRLEGIVCLQKGALELFVCSAGTREHESVLVTKAKPSAVTFALALIGLAPGKPGFGTEGGAFSPPAGDVVSITARFTVEKTEGGAKTTEVVEVPAWRLLRAEGSQEGLDRPIDWVYVGQAGADALRAADREGTVICLSNFVEAVIDVPFESTSVNASLMYEANPKVVPPKGTPVELIIRPTGRRIEPKKVEIAVVMRKGQPILLDGRPIDLGALKDAANAAPVEIRTAVLKADAEETFGRVMQVHDLLRDALMRVHLVVVQPAAAPGTPQEGAAAPKEILVTADDKVRLETKVLTVDEFKAKAAELLKGVAKVHLTIEPKAAQRTVAEVMSIARDQGAAVNLSYREAGKDEEPRK